MRKHSQNNLLSSKIRLHLWRWHRRIGLVSAVFVMLLAITGIALNHSNRLGLNKNFLSPSWLAFFYNIQSPSIKTVATNNDNYISQLNGRQLFLNDHLIGECSGELLGAVNFNDVILVACSNKLLLITGSGELVDQLSPASGIPLPITAIGTCEQAACWQSQDKTYVLNVESMQWQEGATALQTQTVEHAVPATIKKSLLSRYGSDISWERWIQDLHSGRLMGVLGPWIMDGMAILFMLLAATGVFMWTLGRRKRQ